MNRKAIRDMLSKVDESYRLELLYRAIDRLAEEHLVEIFGELIRYADPDEVAGSTPDVFADVETFVEESERGGYYDSFEVNSQNCLDMSDGTARWIAECNRLLGRLDEVGEDEPTEDVAEAFDAIFALLRRINYGDDTIVFFADEGGAWQVGVAWQDVVPAWSRCLVTFETPESCADRMLALIDGFASFHHDEIVAAAAESLPAAHAQALMITAEERAHVR
jgi:hypothetical protein